MPTVTGLGGTPLNMGDPINYGALWNSVQSGGTSSTAFSRSAPFASTSWQFQGAGFGGYDSEGIPSNGTVTSILVSGAYAVQITGLSMPVANFFTMSLETLLQTAFAGADTISGSAAYDNLFGYGGNDTINGGPGGDALNGMAGDDTINAGNDFDQIWGEDGNDNLNGNGGADNMYGGAGTDTIIGGSGADFIYGDAGNDTLDGGDDGDEIHTGSGVDHVNGGAGDDKLFLDRSTVSTALTFSTSGMASDPGVTLADGSTIRNIERYEIVSGSGADTFNVNSLPSLGGMGPSTIDGGAGADTLTADFSAITQTVATYLTWANIESVNVIAGSSDDNLTGGSGNDNLQGGLGNDTLSGGTGGVDVIDGGDGTDVLQLNRESSSAAVTADLSQLSTGTGVTFADGTIVRNVERFTILSGSGNDVYTYNPGANPAGPSFISGGGGIDRLTADLSSITQSISNYLLWSSFEEVRVTAGSGNDYLEGGSGNDILVGNDGGDTLYGGGGGVDSLDGGAGQDYGTIGFAGVTTDTTFSFTGINTQTGTTFANGTFVRNVENLTINAGSGNDTLNLGAGFVGSHTFNGGDGIDTVTGDFTSSGANVIANGGGIGWQSATILTLAIERVVITGSTFDDVLRGQYDASGDDILNGGNGNDTLEGYLGADQLNGGAGADAIYVQGGADIIDGGSGIDTLYYRVGVDQSAAQTFNPTNFAAMASNTGITLANGAFVRNVENINALLGLGNDTIIVGVPGNGTVAIDGNTGFDTLQADFSAETRNIDLGINIQDNGYLSFNGQSSLFSFANIEQFQITGGSGHDSIQGHTANDSLIGGGGNDNLRGGLGADTVEGGQGDDILYGASFSGTPAAADTSADTLRGGAGDDQLIGGAGADILDGGDGNDMVTYLTALAGVTVNLTAPNTNTGDAAGDVFTSIENLFGTNFNDVLTGDANANIIRDRGGNDTLNGEGGDDRLEGEGGNDILNGGDGADVLVGSTPFALSGTDTFNGGDGIDTIDFTDETGAVTINLQTGVAIDADGFTDTLTSVENANGSAFADTITGDYQTNILNGLAGADIIDGAGGADIMSGGLGNDVYYIDDLGDIVIETADGGIDHAYNSASVWALGAYVENLTLLGVASINGTGNNQDNVINGNSSSNYIIGHGGNDTLYGNGGPDTLLGGDGDDIMYGGAGADEMVGNLGNDTYYVTDAGDTVSEGNIAGGVDQVYSTVSFNLATTAYADHLTLDESGGAINGTGNALDNTITGNSAGNTLSGSVGNDTLSAGGGNDNLYGGDGADIMQGGAGADTMVGNLGDDTYYVDDAGDTVSEGNIAGGTDQVYSTVAFNLGPTGFADHLTLQGSANIDGFGNAINNTIIGNSGANALWGNNGNDTLNGGGGNDSLYGGDGVDSLDGGIGADAMVGNFGDDTYYVDNIGDTVSEGNVAGGNDTVISSVNFQLGPTGFVDNLTFTGSANLTGVGNSLNNTLTGNSGNNSLTGNAGDDTLNGGDGNDSLVGGDGADIIDGGAGADAMTGNAGNDTYYVDDVGDTVSEGSNTGGTDHVYASVSFHLGPTGFVENLTLTGSAAINGNGNNSNNTITGNSAANVLTGHGGQDTFVFNQALGPSNIDTIADFSVVDDSIYLNTGIFTTLSAGTLAASAFVIGAAAADADDRIIYNSANGALYYDADGNGVGAAIQFATLTTGLALTNTDFIVGGG